MTLLLNLARVITYSNNERTRGWTWCIASPTRASLFDGHEFNLYARFDFKSNNDKTMFYNPIEGLRDIIS